MKYQTIAIGDTEVPVSRISLGTATFGVRPEAPEVARLVGAALDEGINWFDTANSYGNRAHFDRPGVPPAAARESAEELLGRALPRSARDRLVIATKVGEPVGAQRRNRTRRIDLSRAHIHEQIRISLRRLDIERVDIYYAHHADPATPIEETVEAFKDLVDDGLIGAWAVSNFAAEEVQAAIEVADHHGWPRPVLNQVRYNLVDRQPESRLIPLGVARGTGIVAYSPLAGGLLAGSRSAERPYAGNARWMGANFTSAELQLARDIDDRLADWNCSPAQAALVWLLQRPAVVSAIIGTGSPERLHEAASAADLDLTAEQLSLLDRVGPRGS
jgi:aryl-alcohol dehydrogenase-like predicted oxidoreductase